MLTHGRPYYDAMSVHTCIVQVVANSDDVSIVYDALLQRAVTPAGERRSPSKTGMALSKVHEKLIALLEGKGMTADVEEKLLVMEEYIIKVFRERKRLAAEDDGGAEKVMMSRVIKVGAIGMDLASAKGVLLADPQMGIPPSEKMAAAASPGDRPKKKKSKATDASAATAESSAVTGGPPAPPSNSTSNGGVSSGAGADGSAAQSSAANAGAGSAGGDAARGSQVRGDGAGGSGGGAGAAGAIAPDSPARSSQSARAAGGGGRKEKGNSNGGGGGGDGGGGGAVGPFGKYQQNVRSLLLQRRQAMNAAALNQSGGGGQHNPFKGAVKSSMKKKAKAAMLERDQAAQTLREWRSVSVYTQKKSTPVHPERRCHDAVLAYTAYTMLLIIVLPSSLFLSPHPSRFLSIAGCFVAGVDAHACTIDPPAK